jgi:hypothetical protein
VEEVSSSLRPLRVYALAQDLLIVSRLFYRLSPVSDVFQTARVKLREYTSHEVEALA